MAQPEAVAAAEAQVPPVVAGLSIVDPLRRHGVNEDENCLLLHVSGFNYPCRIFTSSQQTFAKVL
jgi:hypothetical protein